MQCLPAARLRKGWCLGAGFLLFLPAPNSHQQNRKNMSKLSTIPVLRCIHCGRPIKLTNLSTTEPDPDGTALLELMKDIAESALCRLCQNQYSYLAKEGRLDEWHTKSELLIKR
jgi:hypothetical protein